MREFRRIDFGDYKLIKEYENFNLYSYKGLYKTCFLKWDVKNKRAVADVGIGSTAYTARSSLY